LRIGAAAGIAVAGATVLTACHADTPLAHESPTPTPPQGDALQPPTGTITKTNSVPVAGGTVVTVAGEKVVVTQPTKGDFLAFSAICPHAGCAVVGVQNGVIVCPCHGATFSSTTGAVLGGPARAPLATIPVTVQDGAVVFA
jgi:Rieske Fe-S protein